MHFFGQYLGAVYEIWGKFLMITHVFLLAACITVLYIISVVSLIRMDTGQWFDSVPLSIAAETLAETPA